MTAKALWLGWSGVVLLFFVSLGLAFVWMPKTFREVTKVQNERKQLEFQHKDLGEQIKKDVGRYGAIIRRYPWLTESSGGTAFLTRLGDIATGRALRLQEVGPFQREDSPQVEKVGRQVRLAGPFSDILQMVENVERNRGILEELKIQRPEARTGEQPLGEIEAQFRLSSMELNPEIRQRIKAFIAALPEGSKPGADGKAAAGGSLLLPLPAGTAKPIQVTASRDPFMVPSSALTRVAGAGTKGRPGRLARSGMPELTLAGIIESPSGRTAIINNRMVKEGERVEGVLVQAIGKNEVMLKSPFESRKLPLPGLGPNHASPPR